MRKIITCRECEEEKVHHAKGLCQSCYYKQRPKKPRKRKIITCKKCKKEIPHHAFGLCMTCYNHEKGLNKPMSENKLCPLHLGVFINEHLLSKIFKDVKQMPPHNPAFDFICNKNKKIDAKSSVTGKTNKHETKNWNFHISKNKIADYFLCIAYDNRKDLNPLHMWLIPGKDVNDKVGIGISESTLYKWSKYEQTIDMALSCCDKMKEM